jgi:acyl-CoA thioesterase
MTAGRLTASRRRRIEAALRNVPFAKLLGIEVDSIESGVARLALPVREELKQNHGMVHGGAIASLIDTATAFAILTVVPARDRVTTIDLTISYLRPLTKGRATAEAKVVRMGRRIIAVSAEIYDSSGTIAATALSSYLRL